MYRSATASRSRLSARVTSQPTTMLRPPRCRSYQFFSEGARPSSDPPRRAGDTRARAPALSRRHRPGGCACDESVTRTVWRTSQDRADEDLVRPDPVGPVERQGRSATLGHPGVRRGVVAGLAVADTTSHGQRAGEGVIPEQAPRRARRASGARLTGSKDPVVAAAGRRDFRHGEPPSRERAPGFGRRVTHRRCGLRRRHRIPDGCGSADPKVPAEPRAESGWPWLGGPEPLTSGVPGSTLELLLNSRMRAGIAACLSTAALHGHSCRSLPVRSRPQNQSSTRRALAAP